MRISHHIQEHNAMQLDMTFTLTIEAQDIMVRYRPRYFVTADYAHFEFTSPHEPKRRIPVSETGYRSHFSPMHEIEAAPSIEEYARMLLLTLIHAKSSPDEDGEDEGSQLELF
jgi:hypothetical protein